MKTKKRLTKIFAFICTFSLVAQFVFVNAPVSAATVAATASVNYEVTGDPTVDNTIDIAVKASGVTGLYGGSIDFNYDPTVLEVTAITKGTAIPADFLEPVTEIKNGQANLAYTLTGNKVPISATGTIANIKAKVLKGGKTIQLNTAIVVKLSTNGGDPIAATANAASFTTKDKVVPGTVLQPGTYQENNSGLTYSGTWGKLNSTSYDDGSITLSNQANSTLEFTFTGTSFEWYGVKATSRGKASITIDGINVGTLDCYNSSTAYKQLLYKSNELSSGTHKVKITVLGTKNSSATDTKIDVDKIVINNGAPTGLTAGTYQEDNSGLTYSGTWGRLNSTSYDAGSIILSNQANSTLEFTFTGTSFEWYGVKATSRGKASITIDGLNVGTLDCYSSSTAYKQLLYKSNNLSNGTHKVKITVLGTKNSSATDTKIDVDKIVIK